ncbi:putative Protein YciI [Candidatus Terasakiella magnetica]|uniref:YCII-related domain-containing protein n=1 Tax=Candidatus Terasakiella magnetica TaxID=1867952 RepID=A0A1C3RMF6_9PROT|nr:YciI family protein [Candidatus Terasakiella magnetica]SCA58289.1 putative Protein YciI [Candidatus Terasakiella magnetica]
MQFHITALDGTDEAAPQRRESAWAEHLVYLQNKKAEGSFLLGGTIVDENGNKTGSTLFVEAKDQDALMDWLYNDPFGRDNVWQHYDIKTIEIPNI